MWLVIFAASLALGAVVGSAAGQAIPAFPGAEGAGAAALGGRGGDVYFVTSLADTNTPGTLRYGISTAGTTGRTILFRTGGNIELTSDLKLDNPRITIAGQSAPGGGITIADRQTSVSDNDIVIRNVRFRPGNSVTLAAKLNGSSNGSTGEPDSLHIEYVKNVMIDHVSASWSVDEVLSVTNSTNVSVQWSAITEALNVAGHSKGAHGYGSLINGDTISYHHNFYADNNSRNPRPEIATSGTYNNGSVVIAGGTFNFDFRNNVIYNWGDRNGYNGAEAGLMNMNYVGNYSVAGPATPSDKTTQAFSVDQTPTQIYLADNKIDSDKDLVRDGTNTGWAMIVSNPGATITQMAAPVGNTTFVSTQTADAAYQSVMANAGATWWNRDAVDARVFAQPATQTGIFLSPGTSGSASFYPQAFGGYPTLAAGTAPTDSDNDGMPDDWEVSLGLDPNVANNNADFDNDGYTDLEEYLNDLGASPAPLPAVFSSGSSGRYALWSNWDTKWQPSRLDTAQINSGTAIVDAVGQDAGTIQVGTGAVGGSVPTLSITSGGLRVTNELAIGAGAVNQTAGLVTTGTVTFGSGTASGPSTYTLAGGVLAAATIQAASGTAARTLAWSSGTIQNLDAATDLTISGSGGLTLALSGSDTKTFDVDAGRTLTLGARLTGSGGKIIKTGSGTLVLSGSADSFTGGLVYGGGQLTLAGAAPLGSGTLQVVATSTISTQGPSVSLAGPVSLAAGTTLTLSGSGSTVFGGRIFNGGTSASGLVIASTGTTTLSASNGYTGPTTISGSGSTVVLGDNLAFGPSGAVTVTTAAGSTTFTIRAAKDLSGVPNLITLGNGAGTTVFDGTSAMTFTGGMQLSGGSRTMRNSVVGKTLEFSGTTVLGLPGSSSPRTLTISGSGNTLFSGPIVNGGTSGNCNLTITSSGTTKLTGINTYSGTTGVSAGTLVVNGRLGSGTVTVASGATLAGTGTVGGSTTIQSGATLAPGASPGTLTFTQGLTWSGSGNYNWQVLNAAGTAGSSGGWDLASVVGTLSIASTAANPFRINLWSLSSTSPDVSGSAANFDPTRSGSWRIANATGGITGFSADKFQIATGATNGTGGFANGTARGTFSLALSGSTGLDLVFTPMTTLTWCGTGTTPGGDGAWTTGGANWSNGRDVGSWAPNATAVFSGTGGTVTVGPGVTAAGMVFTGSGYTLTGSAAAGLVTTGLVDVGSGSVTVASGLAPADLQARILSGYGDGSWNGTSGITSSAAAATAYRSVGWIDNGGGSLTIGFAAEGDTNLDGVVDLSDLQNILASGKYGTGQAAVWADGDFNLDGVVDLSDLQDVLASGLYGKGVYSTAAFTSLPSLASESLPLGTIAAVPEPNALLLAAVGAGLAALAGGRRSRA